MEHFGKDARPVGPVDLVADVTPELLLCTAAVRAGLVDGCGASAIVGPDEQWPLAATDEVFMEFAAAQFSLWDGPEPEVVTTGLPVIVRDLRAEQHRWPMVAPRLVAQQITSLIALPLSYHGGQVGVFSGYRTRPRRFTDTDVADLRLLSHGLGVIAAARFQGYVPHLPDSSISQSIGMLMERFTIDTDDAVAVLRSQAWNRDIPLPHLAVQMARGTIHIDDTWMPTA